MGMNALLIGALLSLPAAAKADQGQEDWIQGALDAVVGREVTPSAQNAEHLCAAFAFRTGWSCDYHFVDFNFSIPWLVDAVNAIRVNGRWCGTEWMPEQKPLRWSWELQEASRDAIKDMIANGYRGHISPTGMDARKWSMVRGYPYWVQDDLGFGFIPGDENAVLQAWLRDPPHCKPIMDVHARDMAGYFEGGYWALYLGWDGVRY